MSNKTCPACNTVYTSREEDVYGYVTYYHGKESCSVTRKQDAEHKPKSAPKVEVEIKDGKPVASDGTPLVDAFDIALDSDDISFEGE